MTSEPFSTTAKDHIHCLARLWISRNWSLMAFILAVVAIWAWVDIRAIYVGLITIFFIYPMVMALVWFSYALSERSIQAITPKRISITDRGLSVQFLPLTDDRPPLPSISITWSDIKSAELSGKKIAIILGNRIDERIDIPLDAFEKPAIETLLAHLSPLLQPDNVLD